MLRIVESHFESTEKPGGQAEDQAEEQSEKQAREQFEEQPKEQPEEQLKEQKPKEQAPLIVTHRLAECCVHAER